MDTTRRPTKSLAGIMILGCAALLWMGLNTYSELTTVEAFSAKVIPLHDLRGRILQYDEILTMSARMAAATGDPAWETRYRGFEKELDLALLQARHLTPAPRGASSRTEEANRRLQEMENRAFDLTRRGAKSRAMALLGGADYNAQKSLYAQGMQELLESLETTAAEEMRRHRRRALWNGLVMALLIPALVVMGFHGWKGISRWQKFVLQGMAMGLNGRLQAEESLFKLRSMEHYLAELSSRLMRSPGADLDAEVQAALKTSAEMVHADRSYLFQVSSDGHFYTNTHEHCREGVMPFREELQNIPWGSFPYFESVIQKSEDFVFDSLDQLPPEAASEKSEYEKEGIRSLAIVPLMIKEKVRGWLGFDVIGEKRVWKEEEISLLKMLGGLLMDAMDRRRYTAQIEEQAEWLDQAADAILLLDVDGRTLYENLAARALFPKGAAVPEPIFAEALSKARELGQWSAEWRRKNASGPDAIFRGRWSLVRNADGRPRGVLTFHTDISETKKMEEQFLRSQRLESIGTLAGGIAHDLNNVLSPLMMAVPLLKRAIKDPGLDAILDMLASNVKRGTDLVKQVLGFSRGHHGDKMPLELGPLVQEMEKIVRSTFPKDIAIEAVLGETRRVLADPTQVHQVLLNLCVNARDAMPGGGRILITLEDRTLGNEEAWRLHADAKPGPYAVLKVEDNGTGIAPEIIDKIFDPFFTTKEPGKGTGIGLATVSAIMKNHGGFLSVYSEVRQGTRFSLYFPVTEGAGKSAGKGEAPLPSGHGESVLVVDDELSMREINRATLSAYGYRVMTAADGAEAVSVFAEQKGAFDVVVVDVNMPVMDGAQTIRALRRIDPKVRVIASSGLNAKENMVDTRDMDALAFLPKPYGADKLLWAVHDVLKNANACRLPK